VPSGSEGEARKYYTDLGTKIGFQVSFPSGSSSGTTLVDVARYLGYAKRAGATSPELTAKDLQDIPPAELMDPAKLSARLGGTQVRAGDVLVARFFAPKISDVSQPSVTQAGWRKLVRLRSLPGSPAATHGIESGIILFNFFAALDSRDPFAGNNSVNTQVILVAGDKRRSLHWLDFDNTTKGAPLSFALNAFFDAGHVPSFANLQAGAASYYVPCGCISCHGGLRFDFTTRPPAPDLHYRAPLLDYLDTDHWHDRASEGDDFAGLKAPILFDPGAFAIVLQLNEEFARQNAAAQPDSVLRRAADHWVAFHRREGDKVAPLFERALPRSSTSPNWKSSDATDAQLLPKLNRFCFRCHGSVFFDVFDKQMILDLKANLNATLYPRSEIVDERAAMPPDRTLSDADLKQLRDLVLAVR
jgi:hypothetical protein